jgi:hypothetical protein
MQKDPTRVDLIRSHATHLELTAETDLSPSQSVEVFSKFGTLAEQETRMQRFGTRYRRSTKGHYCQGTFLQMEPDGLAHDFRLEYFADLHESLYRQLRLPGRVPPVIQMLEVLSEISEEQLFRCRATFEYSKPRYVSNVGLPMKIAEGTSLPFTGISGIHFKASDEDLPIYDVIVEHGSPDDDSVAHMLSFAYVAEFGVDLPHSVLDVGSNISLRFGGPENGGR